MSVYDNITIYNDEQKNMNPLKLFKSCKQIKNIRRSNLTPKITFWT